MKGSRISKNAESGTTDPSAVWSIPSYEESIYRDKEHRYALVVPVVNEGERIQAQLRHISALALPIDVVIADGGSTDGSLEDDFLRESGVRARLTKTGDGKLSAQLRMAYAWCLDHGYTGIVTMDGNNKDGAEALSLFIDRLNEGYDYIQGSRYMTGGIAENTPLDRIIGNRVIQAPILSFAGLRRYTDTTNGFRGYSSRILLDPAVAPFRSEFQTYQLLSYLTVRAGQLNYRTCEVPVSRRYPRDEPVPTKIVGWSARLALFSETLQAACGRFHPIDRTKRSIKPHLNDVLFAFLVIVPFFLIGAAYIFPGTNHGQELPPILKLMDSTLFVGDFAVEDFLKPGPRWFYNHVMAGLIGAGFTNALAYLVLYVAAIGSIATAILTLGRRFTDDSSAGLSMIGVMLVALSLLPKSQWDSAFVANIAIPSAFAMGITAWGITAASAERWILAYTFFGLAALMQFLIGFLPGFLLAPIFLSVALGQRRYKTLAWAMLLWGAGLAAIYVPMTIDQAGSNELIGGRLDSMWLFGPCRPRPPSDRARRRRRARPRPPA